MLLRFKEKMYRNPCFRAPKSSTAKNKAFESDNKCRRFSRSKHDRRFEIRNRATLTCGTSEAHRLKFAMFVRLFVRTKKLA